MLAPSLFECALQCAPDAIVITDAAGRILFVNHAAESLFGYGQDALSGELIERLVPEALRARHSEWRERFHASPRKRPMGAGLDVRARRRDGTQFAAQIALSPVSDGERVLVLAAIRDVTERQRVEAELGAAREAAERARQSACEARDRANRADQAKSRFLATASHDLRQPLQTLALLNGTLRRLTGDPVLTEVLGQQERAIGAMSRLVNALLDIGKFEAGAVRAQISEFPAEALLEPLRQEFTPLAQHKGLGLRLEAQNGTLRTDAALLEQVLRNLLSNALKYTQRGQITLRCVFEPTQACIEVADTGIGIPQEQLGLIFTEFFQVDTPANMPRSGYGLGLSIVHRIVNLLGLKLEVHSVLAAGSCFRLMVPAGAPPSEAAGAVPAVSAVRLERPAAAAARILLIEDEASVRVATELLLRAAGYEVLAGASKADALEQLERHAGVDLLISDFHLAGAATGLEVIDEVRARLGARLPVILLSGDTSASVQGLQGDPHWRIARKPLHAEGLLTLIGELLGP